MDLKEEAPIDVVEESAPGEASDSEKIDVETIAPRDENGTLLDECRILLSNVPKFLGYKGLKSFFAKHIPNFGYKKVRQVGNIVYVSFDQAEEAKRAVEILDGQVLKKSTLKARAAPTDLKKTIEKPSSTLQLADPESLRAKTAKSIVSPLADLPYPEQITKKHEKSLDVALKLTRTMQHQQSLAKDRDLRKLVKEVVPSAIYSHYRNKNEFTVGHDLDGQICVGFVGGKFSENKHFVIPLGECNLMSTQTRKIVEDFQEFVGESGLAPFDEFARVGTWKMLTIREFSGDVMMIVTLFPLATEEKFSEVKEALAARYINLETLRTKGFRVTSLYVSVMEHAGDVLKYDLVAGAPYIYETILGCRFRVSAGAFFQTNTVATATLYTQIAKQCGLYREVSEQPYKTQENVTDDAQPAEKRMRPAENGEEAKKMVLLDICCGTGTIGQTILANYPQENAFCIGVEIVESAVADAKINAEANKLADRSCYIAAKAEDAFRSIKYYLPPGFTLENSEFIGVLDPPRAGLQNSIVVACRQLDTLKRLVYVSCDPANAMRNLSDLCRPTSNKFGGVPFSIETIQPVDLFPQTAHIEWVVTLVR
ncbi:unnamed protein product, partial [Mesorhabditis spiculigera]